MKIAVNLFLTSPKSITGAFVYIENILPALFRIDKENTFYLIGESDSIEYFRSKYGSLPNVRFYTSSIKHDLFMNPLRAVSRVAAKISRDYQTREDLIAQEINGVLRREGVEIYFSPASLYPRGLSAVRIVTTIHDLQPEYFPENFPPAYLVKRKEDMIYAVEHSSRLIAISEYTKKSLQDRYHAATGKIAVIYHAPQEKMDGVEDIETPQEFIFYPAALWPHKNHHILIKALGILKDRFPLLQAVCTGMTKGGRLKDKLEALAASEGLTGRVSFLGYVSDDHISLLYARARALVFPSAFEGFGLPLVEAFQYDLPVIASNNSSITEIVGEAGILVETGDAKALADAIEKVLTDTTLRETLVQKGRERARLFSWEKAGRETFEVFIQASLDTERGNERRNPAG